MVHNESMMCLHCSFDSHLSTITLFTMKSFLLSVIKIISLMILAYMGYKGSIFDCHLVLQCSFSLDLDKFIISSKLISYLYLRCLTFLHIVEVCDFNMLFATYFTALFSEDMMVLKNDRNFRSNIQSRGRLSVTSGI